MQKAIFLAPLNHSQKSETREKIRSCQIAKMEFNRRNSFNSENIFFVSFPLNCVFCHLQQNAIGARPNLFLAVRNSYAWTTTSGYKFARKIVTFPGLFHRISFSKKTKFIFNAPPYASAKAFYLYLLHDTSNFSRAQNEK